MPLDQNNIRMAGTNAEIRVGYETAVVLGRWTLEIAGGEFVVSAHVQSRNMHWLTAGYPLDLCIKIKSSEWRWRNVTVSGDNPLSVYGRGKPEVYQNGH